MATLLLMRHAQAEPGDHDHARELTGRGRRDARAAGRWLAAAGHRPDLVLCSDSARTRQTTDLVLAELMGAADTQPAPTVQARADLYLTSAQRLLHLLAETAPDVASVLVVGHEPTTSEAVAALTGRLVPVPTATVATIEVPSGGWSALGEQPARLLAVHVPDR